jgi:hypothetical protein
MNERVFDGFCGNPDAFCAAAYLAKKTTQNGANWAKTRRSR